MAGNTEDARMNRLAVGGSARIHELGIESSAPVDRPMIQGFARSGRPQSDCTERMREYAKSVGVADALCDEVLQGFAGRASVGLADAAKILRMHVKTLRIHIADGSVGFIQKGTGTERPRRIFTPNDLIRFYAGQRRREIARGLVDARRLPNFD